MDDTLLVGGFEGFGDLDSELEGFLDRERTLLQPVGQRVAL